MDSKSSYSRLVDSSCYLRPNSRGSYRRMLRDRSLRNYSGRRLVSAFADWICAVLAHSTTSATANIPVRLANGRCIGSLLSSFGYDSVQLSPGAREDAPYQCVVEDMRSPSQLALSGPGSRSTPKSRRCNFQPCESRGPYPPRFPDCSRQPRSEPRGVVIEEALGQGQRTARAQCGLRRFGTPYARVDAPSTRSIVAFTAVSATPPNRPHPTHARNFLRARPHRAAGVSGQPFG